MNFPYEYVLGVIVFCAFVCVGAHINYRTYVKNPEALPRSGFERRIYPNGLKKYFHHGEPALFYEVPSICLDMGKLRASRDWKLLGRYSNSDGSFIEETDAFKEKLKRFQERYRNAYNSHSGKVPASVCASAPYAYYCECYVPKNMIGVQRVREEETAFS